jgi:uncharacterized protein (TIGR02466 family)
MAVAPQTRVFTLFPTVVQISEIPNAAALNKKLLDAVYEVKRTTPNSLPPTWCCHLYTTIASPIELLARAEFQELRRHIQTEAERYADGLHLDRARHPLKINECWINVYNTNDAQEIHCHTNSVISGVYYVKAPPGSSPLMFHSPMADVMLNPPSTKITELNLLAAAFEAVEGQMILFRSWLKHSVKPSTIKDDRVSIAFNITM